AWLHRETQREPDFGKALTQGVSFRFLERRTKRKGQRVRYGLAPGPPLRRGSGSFRRLRGRRAPSSEPSPAPPATCPPCQGIGVIVRSAAVRRPPSTARSAWARCRPIRGRAPARTRRPGALDRPGTAPPVRRRVRPRPPRPPPP